ncbi:MAG: heavy metal translocating P-type ATPase [Firmicutes bacterium]|nr:heavy metal translocating P-type ATPase [Bacillota bacterium]
MQGRTNIAIRNTLAEESGCGSSLAAGNNVAKDQGKTIAIEGEVVDTPRRAATFTTDYYADKLVPWSVGIAVLTYLLTHDVARSLAVLIAGCPIAVALSKHTAVGAALGVAARDGVYVKDARYFETISKADTIIMDKTSVITAAFPEVKEVVAVEKKFSADEWVSPSDKFKCCGVFADPKNDADIMPMLVTGVLCNNAKLVHGKTAGHGKVISLDNHKASGWQIDGDPTDGAIIVAAAKAGVWQADLEKEYIRILENPFESEEGRSIYANIRKAIRYEKKPRLTCGGRGFFVATWCSNLD